MEYTINDRPVYLSTAYRSSECEVHVRYCIDGEYFMVKWMDINAGKQASRDFTNTDYKIICPIFLKDTQVHRQVQLAFEYKTDFIKKLTDLFGLAEIKKEINNFITASDLAATADQLAGMSESWDDYVLNAVLSHRNTPKEISEKIKAVSKYETTSTRALIQFTNDPGNSCKYAQIALIERLKKV